MSTTQIEQLLEEGIAAAKASQKKLPAEETAKKTELRERARQILLRVTELSETNINAWLWLSTVAEGPNDKLACLTNVLTLDPDNPTAKKGVALLKRQFPQLEEPLSPTVQKEPDVLPLPLKENQAKCPFCNASISKMDSPCPKCKTPLVMDCPACSVIMDVEWDTCTQCGYPMGDYQLGSVYFTLLSTSYREHHRNSKALAALKVAENLNPDQPDLYRQMGEVLAELNEPSAAITMLEKAVEKEPVQIGPYMALGKVLQQEGQWEHAEVVYRKAMKTAPDSSEPYYTLGDLLLHQSRLQEAKNLLQKATRLDPQHGQAWARLGQLFDESKKAHSAVYAYRRAKKHLLQGTEDWRLVQERLRFLDPQLPTTVARSWSKLFQYMVGPIIIIIVALILDSGFQMALPHWTTWLAVLLGITGAWLWVSAYTLPKNPPMRLLTGNEQGIIESDYRQIISIVGALLFAIAIIILLLPFG